MASWHIQAHIRTITGVEVIDVGITKGATSDSVTANSNAAHHKSLLSLRQHKETDIPGDRSDHIENLKKHGLGDGGVKLADVKGRGRGGHVGNRRVIGSHRSRGRGRGGRRSLGGRNRFLGLSDGRSGRHIF